MKNNNKFIVNLNLEQCTSEMLLNYYDWLITVKLNLLAIIIS